MIETNKKLGQFYGYSVCFICVVVFLISLNGIIGSAIDLTDPVRAEYHDGYGPTLPLSSFAAYKVAARRQPGARPQAEFVGPAAARAADTAGRGNRPGVLSDEELRQNYDAEREERIGDVRFRAVRTLVSGLIFIVLTAGLFAGHWKWLRRTELTQA
jgi:hypothetical protein